MQDAGRLEEHLACPRCDKKPLVRDVDRYRCSGCKAEFPDIGGIPWLFADAESALGEWRNRLHYSLQQLSHESQRIKAELIAEDRRELTRKRLEQQLAATDKHKKMLRQMLSPVDVQSMQAGYESQLALRTRLPVDQGLNTYYANVHRDWAWGDRENDASLAQIRSVLPKDAQPGKVLVLGAGACRLAYDMHMQLRAEMTVALDFNPLLMLVARQVVSGETLQMYEFPMAPKSLDDYAVLRKLQAPEPVRENFFLLLGDVLRPPFSAGVFDTVVTPWLIDIVSEDLTAFAARINILLKPGGRWINFGSLAFDSPDRARRYSPEEVLVIAGECGFAPPQVTQAAIPYMCSPASRHCRQETVFTFSAVKQDEAENPGRHKALPDWIVTGDVPVPLLPSFRTQAMSTQIYSFIMSLIDGKRSIRDMAKVLEQQKLMTRKEAEPAIRNFLTRMYDDSQRLSGY
ncbi:MAG: carnosine N-methyltransferase family protein [Woeseiaceae bacterium]|nr:carnosine N-methyltransferase family protein [Woeseiaceae bacterium]